MSARYQTTLFVTFVAALLGGLSTESVFAQAKPAPRKVAQTKRVAKPRPQVPAGRDAFLPYQVNSTDELVAELSANRALRQRYARHFGIAENKVVDFVKNALIVYRVPQEKRITTYGVTRSGRIYPVASRLKKGERVWATRSGLPVLRWACANPLTKTLPGTLLASTPKPATKKRINFAPKNTPVPAPIANADSPALDVEASPLLSNPGPVAVDTSALLPAPALGGGGTSSGPAIGPSLPGGGIGPGFLPLLLPIAGFIGGNPGGGDSNPFPPGTTITLPLPPPGSGGFVPVVDSGPAIPEPGTWGLFAVGSMGLLALRRRS